MKIPNYILKKIEKHNALLFQAAKIESEIDDWYDKKLAKKTKPAAFRMKTLRISNAILLPLIFLQRIFNITLICCTLICKSCFLFD